MPKVSQIKNKALNYIKYPTISKLLAYIFDAIVFVQLFAELIVQRINFKHLFSRNQNVRNAVNCKTKKS